MKKIICSVVMAVVALGGVDASAAQYNCQKQNLSGFQWGAGAGFGGWTSRKSNEYLFENDADYQAKIGWVCGQFNDYGCDMGMTVTMPAGHWWKNQQVNQARKYVCNTKGGNEWMIDTGTGGVVANTENTFHCESTNVSFDGNQRASDNEFLYSSVAAYNSVKNEKDSGTVDGWVYECDNKHCKNRVQKTLEAGHVFEGRMITRRATYQCQVGAEDKWVEVYADVCPFRQTNVAVGDWWINNSDKRKLTRGECLQIGFGDNTDTSADYFYARCDKVNGVTLQMRCYNTDANPAPNPKPTPNPNPNPAPNPTPAPPQPGGGSSGTTCRQNRAGADWSEAARACCDLPASVAVVEGKTGCRCLGSGKTFKIINGRGVCVSGGAGGGTPVVGGFTCPDESALLNAYKQRCVNHAEALQAIADFENACAAKQVSSMDEYNSLKDVVWLYVQECGAAAPVATPAPTVSVDVSVSVRNRVQTAHAALESMIADFDVTVWRNEEGKFNTARLASDSIAGVVLGTAGGLITSNVIKKNQVKNGLEDIQCTVGGQVVGSLGDEFRVGIQ